MFDDGAAAPTRERLDLFVADLADYGRHCGAKTRFALRAAIALIVWSPAWVIGAPAPFGRLSPEARARHLAKAEATALPLVVQGVKTVFAICWYELHPDLMPAPERRRPRAGEEYAGTVAQAAPRRRA